MSNVNTPFGAIPGIPAFTTTTTKACNPSFVSLTLKAGEKFVLPSGAKIISSTAGAAALESDCADINVEVPECYLFAWGGAWDPSSATNMWTNDRTYWKGITISGTFYPSPDLDIIANNRGGARTDLVINWINSHPVLRNLLTCLGGNTTSDTGPGSFDGNGRGGFGTLCFKTIPSIANSMFGHIFTGAEAGANGGGGPVNALLQPYKASSFNHPRGVCGCTC